MLLPVGYIMKVLTMHTADFRISLKYIYIAMRDAHCTYCTKVNYGKLSMTKLFTKGRLPLKVM